MARGSYSQHDQNPFPFSSPQSFNLTSRQQQQQQDHSVVSLPHPSSVGSNSYNIDNNRITGNSNNVSSNSNTLTGINFPSVSSQLDESALSHRQISRHMNSNSIPALDDFNNSSTVNQLHNQRSYQQQTEGRSDPFQQQLQRQQHVHHIRRHNNHEISEEDAPEMYSDAREPPGESSLVSIGQKRRHEDSTMSSGQSIITSHTSQKGEYDSNAPGTSESANRLPEQEPSGSGGKPSRGSYTKWSTEQTCAVFDSLSRVVRESDSDVRWCFNVKILETVAKDLMKFNKENNIEDTRTLPVLMSAVKHHIRNTKDKYIVYAELGNKEGVTFNDDGWLVCDSPARAKQLKHAKYFREKFPVKRHIENMLRDSVELQQSLGSGLKDIGPGNNSNESSQPRISGHGLGNGNFQNRRDNNRNQRERSEEEDEEEEEEDEEEEDGNVMNKEGSNQILPTGDSEVQQNSKSGSLYMNRSILNQTPVSNSFNTSSIYKRTNQHRLQQQRQQQQQQQQTRQQQQDQGVGLQDLSGPLPMLNMNVNGMNNINTFGDVGPINPLSNMNNNTTLNTISHTRSSPVSNLSNVKSPASTVLNRNMTSAVNRGGNSLQMSSIGTDVRKEGSIGNRPGISNQNQGSVSVMSGTSNPSQQSNNSPSLANNNLRSSSPSHTHHNTYSNLNNRGGTMSTMNHLTNLGLLNNMDSMGQNSRGNQVGNNQSNVVVHNDTNSNNSLVTKFPSSGNNSSNNNTNLNQMHGAISSPSTRNTTVVSRLNQHSLLRNSQTHSRSFSNASGNEHEIDVRESFQNQRVLDDGFHDIETSEISDMSTYYLMKHPPPSNRGMLLTTYLHCDPRGREIMKAANKFPSSQKFDCLENICLIWATEFFNDLKKKPGYSIIQSNLHRNDTGGLDIL